MVDELYKKEISTNKHLDARLKKNIVNICLGVLEKTTNKRSNSMVFDSLSEALYYKEQLGGTIQILRRWERKKGEITHDEDLNDLPIKAKDEDKKIIKMFIYSLRKKKLTYLMDFVIIKSLYIKFITIM